MRCAALSMLLIWAAAGPVGGQPDIGQALGAARRALHAASAARPFGSRVPYAEDLELSQSELAALVASLPGRSVSAEGRPAFPLNIVFVGSEDQVRSALAPLGWADLPNSTIKCFWAGLRETLDGRALRHFPPFRTFYVEGRPQAVNQALIVVPIQARHHFRLWRHVRIDRLGREIWPGGANFDRGVHWRGLYHLTDPDIDTERGFLAAQLARSPLGPRLSLVASPNVPRGGRESNGNGFFTDGRVLVVEFPPGLPVLHLPPGLR